MSEARIHWLKLIARIAKGALANCCETCSGELQVKATFDTTRDLFEFQSSDVAACPRSTKVCEILVCSICLKTNGVKLYLLPRKPNRLIYPALVRSPSLKTIKLDAMVKLPRLLILFFKLSRVTVTLEEELKLIFLSEIR